MPRREFSTRVRKEALRRSGGLCEAVGKRYGLEPGQRCEAPLSHGVQFDHERPDWYNGEPTLENCRAVCRQCHKHATHQVDAPRMAKARRNNAKHIGAKAPSRTPLPGGRRSKWKRKMNGEVVERD